MKQIGKSIRARLYNIAAKENANYQHVLIRYFHERLLYRLSLSSYCNNFYLKGGTLLYAFETGEKKRYTLDIDFSLRKMEFEMDTIKNAFHEICKINDEDGVRFDSETLVAELIKENDRYGGLRVFIQATLDTIKQRLQVDIGYGDTVYPSPQMIGYPVLLSDLSQPVIQASTLETVIAEKFHAMIELSGLNSRMKDFYDVYQLLSAAKYDEDALKEAVVSTFDNRRTGFLKDHLLFTESFVEDSNRTRMWQAFLRKIGHRYPLSFSEVMEMITKVLKPAWELLSDLHKK
jgi:predicted nucleotidyltransferase component of viral defense system